MIEVILITLLVMVLMPHLCRALGIDPGLKAFSKADIDSYNKNGFLVVRGLLSEDDTKFLIEQARRSMEKPETPFDKMVKSAYTKIEFNTLLSSERLANITCNIPVHQLMKIGMRLPFLPPAGGKVRVLKDAFLTFKPGLEGCGWHVDDESFWPTKVHNRGHEGLNVWIALSDYCSSQGGGLAIAPGSHRKPWTGKARDLLRKTGRTCALAEIGPDYHSECEKLALRTMDMKPGDAIIHSRWLFHRSDPFSSVGAQSTKEPLMRYSVRYMPEAAIISSNFDAVVKANEQNGKNLKAIGSKFHPLVSDLQDLFSQ